MRFCSRCGFPLTGVALLLDSEGDVTKLPTISSTSNRGRMLWQSALMTVVAWGTAIALTLLWDAGGTTESAARLAAMLFGFLGLVGLITFAYSFLFVRNQSAGFADRKPLAGAAQAALPPQKSEPAGDFIRRNDTREMVSRPSVTENTTRLLDHEQNSRDE
ncbi:MAG: hypothetical protein ABJB97_05045 [Acidobacteriota bacterium]